MDTMLDWTVVEAKTSICVASLDRSCVKGVSSIDPRLILNHASQRRWARTHLASRLGPTSTWLWTEPSASGLL